MTPKIATAIALAAFAVAFASIGCSKSSSSSSSGSGSDNCCGAPAGKVPAAGKAPAAAKASAGDGALLSGAAGQVKIGQSIEDVTKILGEPTSRTTVSAGGKKITNYTWQKDGRRMHVQFVDGKVTVAGNFSDAAGGEAEADGKAAENFGKVTAGMDEAEVVKLLGPPTSQVGGAGAAGAGGGAVWRVGKKTYFVVFTNGKVQHTQVMTKDE